MFFMGYMVPCAVAIRCAVRAWRMLHRLKKKESVMQHSYKQLAQRLVDDIKAGRYAMGERLPSVRTFATAQGVSVSTTIRCYRYLESLGLVQARSKSGMYVADWKALQPRLAAAAPPRHRASQAPVEYDKLVSLQHRMTELYSLTAQPLHLGLHLANAAPAWYAWQALACIASASCAKTRWPSAPTPPAPVCRPSRSS
ncbi:MAG: winged helix-turn-helix domain-containing protein [Gemmobacter sp.]|nr:winged helix-turn-helix domain-containing protein [Gemmobacter sp.]